MVFNSLQYLLFLTVVYVVFYFVANQARWIVLLTASLFFYATLDVPYLLLILALVTLTTYVFGIWMGQSGNPKTKLQLLWGGIAVNLLILVTMKYIPFVCINLKTLAGLFLIDTKIQPVRAFIAIGVSYFVFQAISYLIDIYLELVEPERHFGHFALYLSYFPKLLQGPIERAGDLLPQLKSRLKLEVLSGLPLFLWGLFKKVVIADRIAIYVNAVYNNSEHHTGITLLLATYAYAFQIYYDFSGYTDMALGTARMVNINLTQNFNRPYFAISIADFWRRWHISFSRWIFDYIFKPLQMQWRNWKNWGTVAALILAFLASGLWHGASWGFVIWGLLHGVFLASSFIYKPYQKKLHRFFGFEKSKLLKFWQIFVTFNLVCFTWIFFRTDSLQKASSILGKISKLSGPIFIDDDLQILQCIAPLTFLLIFEMRREFIRSDQAAFPQGHWFTTQLTCAALIIAIILLGVFDSSQFIYFQF